MDEAIPWRIAAVNVFMVTAWVKEKIRRLTCILGGSIFRVMDKTKSKLNRIEGQVKGIGRMYDDRRGCLEIVQQIIAARQALGRVGKDILAGEAVACSRKDNVEEFDELIKKLFELT